MSTVGLPQEPMNVRELPSHLNEISSLTRWPVLHLKPLIDQLQLRYPLIRA
jgi:hypothetical protein